MTRFRIGGMDCGSCALTIEQAVSRLPGVQRVRVDFTTETLEAQGEASDELIASRVRDLGYRVLADDGHGRQAAAGQRDPSGFLRLLWREGHTRVALLVTAALVLVAGLSFMLPGAPEALLPAALTAAVIVVGAPILVRGVRSLLIARHVTIDLLMGIAAAG
ncbi:MAG TPA: cation transporter, partial [Steroidobacteraceae bacterium]|nr:cation transporter [Steroidobacteraceae bacterium]